MWYCVGNFEMKMNLIHFGCNMINCETSEACEYFLFWMQCTSSTLVLLASYFLIQLMYTHEEVIHETQWQNYTQKHKV